MIEKIACLGLGIVLGLGVSEVGAADPRAEAVAPFLDDATVMVARINVDHFDAERLARRLAEDRDAAATLTSNIGAWLAALREAGARDLYLIERLDDLQFNHHPFVDAAVPSAVVALTGRGDLKAIEQLLRGEGGAEPPCYWPRAAWVRGAVFAGSDDAVQRVARSEPVARPELGEALAVASGSAAEVVFMPPADVRRVFEEMAPNFPEELGGGPITTLTRGLRWAVLTLDDDPGPVLRLVVQARDASAARDLARIGAKLDRTLRESNDLKSFLPEFGAIADRFGSEIQGDRLVVSSSPGEAGAWASALIGPFRRRTARVDCAENLKQIGLAMHNYLDVHGTFPPAFVADDAGKPLLSWRVLILPYLDEGDLYREFRLDEPWDGPHNKPLIGRMPRVFACPSALGEKLGAGETTYLTLRGPRTLVPGRTGVTLKEVVDGTSNTIMTLDAPADRAVVWTRPDDLDAPAESGRKRLVDVRALLSRHGQGANAGFADGSVRFLSESISPLLWQALTTRNGGEVVPADGF